MSLCVCVCVQPLYQSGHACTRLIYDHFSLFVGFVKWHLSSRDLSAKKKNESCFSVEINPDELK